MRRSAKSPGETGPEEAAESSAGESGALGEPESDLSLDLEVDDSGAGDAPVAREAPVVEGEVEEMIEVVEQPEEVTEDAGAEVAEESPSLEGESLEEEEESLAAPGESLSEVWEEGEEEEALAAEEKSGDYFEGAPEGGQEDADFAEALEEEAASLDEDSERERPKLVPILGQAESGDSGAETSAEGKAATRSRGLPIGLWILIAALLSGVGYLYYRNEQLMDTVRTIEGQVAEMGAASARLAEQIEGRAVEAGEAKEEVPGAIITQNVETSGSAGSAGSGANAATAGEREEPAKAAEPIEGGDSGGEEESSLESLERRLEMVEKRQRLSSYADEAISTGSRFAYSQLDKAFNESASLMLKTAANSEIIRVESVYVRTAAMRYRGIPMDLIDPTLTSDTELSVEQLGNLLLSSAVPPESRARAAELMGMHRTFEACEYLVDCILTDPNLAVLQQATRSFQKVAGYVGGRVFGGKEVDRWFEENRERLREELGGNL